MTFLRLNLVLILLMAFLLVTDWPYFRDFVSVPNGVRHIAILVTFLFLALNGGGKIKIPKNYSAIALPVILWSAVSIISASNGVKPYLVGWVFTYLFAFIFILGYSYKASDRELIAIIETLMWIIFAMSIPSFVTGLIEGGTLRKLPGGFRELGAFAMAMNMATVFAIFLFYIKNKRRYLAIAVFFVLCIAMTVLKKSIIEFLLIGVIAWVFLFPRLLRRRSGLLGVGLLLPAIFLFIAGDLSDNIAENVDYLARVGVDGHVRFGMYIASFAIALDFFPFGGGYGSFGSLASIAFSYSPLYELYEVSQMGSNSAQDVAQGHHTLLDTFWPHIIAESGFIGAFLYLLLFTFPIRLALRFSSISKLNRAYAFVVISTITLTIIDGFALYTPEIPIFIFLSHGLSAFLCRRMVSTEAAVTAISLSSKGDAHI